MAQNAVSKKPQGAHTLSPSFTLKNAAKAIEFYKDVLGAKQKYRMDMSDGKVMHAELELGDSSIMLTEYYPERNMPESKNSTYVYVDDVDATFKKAKDNGAKTQMEPDDMFWGDRMASFIDPFSQQWSIGMHVQEVSDNEVKRRTEELFSKSSEKNAA